MKLKRLVAMLLALIMAGNLAACTIGGSKISSGEDSDDPSTEVIDTTSGENTIESKELGKDKQTDDKKKKKEEYVPPKAGEKPNKVGAPMVEPEPMASGFIKGVTDKNMGEVLKNKTLRYYVAETWQEPYQNAVIKGELYKKYKFQVTSMPSKWLEDNVQNLLDINAGKQVDLIGIGHEKLPQVYSLLKPLNNEIDMSKKAGLKGIDVGIMENMKKDNNYMFLPYRAGKEAIIYNVELFKKAGKKEPYDLYKEGKWDWKAFAETIDFFTEDADRNNVPEKYGFGCWPRTYHEYSLTNGDGYFSYNKGKVSSRLMEADVNEAISFMRNTYQQEKGFYAFKGMGQYSEFNEKGTVAMLQMGYVWNTKKKEFGMCPMPKGPKGENMATSLGIGYGIPNKTIKPEYRKAALVYIENLLAFQEKQEMAEYENTFKNNSRWKEQYEVMHNKVKTKLLILYGVADTSKHLLKLEDAIFNKSASVTQAIKSLEPIFDREAQKVYNLGK